MVWRYQVMRKEYTGENVDESEKYYYEVHEYFWEKDAKDKKDEKPGWTLEGMKPYGQSYEEVIENLEQMLQDAKKNGVLDYENGKFLQGPLNESDS